MIISAISLSLFPAVPHRHQVLLGEVNAGHSTTQVVVKELKASASIQEQMKFLEEVQPYRSALHLLLSPSIITMVWLLCNANIMKCQFSVIVKVMDLGGRLQI